MSKSLGNVVAPQEIIKTFGAEILRLWVSAEDYRDDVRISKEILARLAEAYRKLRNTARFLLGNLHDFNPENDSVEPETLVELDRWILHRTQGLLGRCLEAYQKFEFHIVYHALNNFCSVDLSALYLDIAKDRLYCSGTNSRERRSAQTTLDHILKVLVHLMAPILSFTAEEIWEHMPDRKTPRQLDILPGFPESVLLSQMPHPDKNLIDEILENRWGEIFKIRGEILKALEAARNNGNIGHSLDAKVILYPESYKKEESYRTLLKDGNLKWDDIAIVSQVEFRKPEPGWQSEDEGKLELGVWEPAGPMDSTAVRNIAVRYFSPILCGRVEVLKASGQKCERCWKYNVDIGKDSKHPTVCPRCSEVLRSEIPS
jgi:isoleucyl-tRNA synthetase